MKVETIVLLWLTGALTLSGGVIATRSLCGVGPGIPGPLACRGWDAMKFEGIALLLLTGALALAV
jgi:hypothetical protein